MKTSCGRAMLIFFFFNDTATTEIYTLSLHDALPVGILAPASPLGWALVGYRVLTASRHSDRTLERHQARSVEIRAAGDLPREVDGEVISSGRSLTVTVVPGVLTVRVPGPR